MFLKGQYLYFVFHAFHEYPATQLDYFNVNVYYIYLVLVINYILKKVYRSKKKIKIKKNKIKK